jgi:hypothetical protein
MYCPSLVGKNLDTQKKPIRTATITAKKIKKNFKERIFVYSFIFALFLVFKSPFFDEIKSASVRYFGSCFNASQTYYSESPICRTIKAIELPRIFSIKY